jgi:pimeloyl-ACP methyl ester carboxylesterase
MGAPGSPDAVDIPGEPGLSVVARPQLDSDAYIRWLTEVLDGLSVDRASLVGISLGGWLATQVAIRRADRVNRLVLLSPSGIGRQKTGTPLHRRRPSTATADRPHSRLSHRHDQLNPIC